MSNLLGTVWSAYDDVHHSAWSNVDWSSEYDDLERSLSEDLANAINQRMDSYSSVHILHGASEREARAPSPAQPPEYDIAFQWREDPRLMWPLEAKVLKSDKNTKGNLKDYVETVQDRFLTGKYAPFANGGAMVAYLKLGDSETVISHIATRLSVTMTHHPDFAARCHKMSDHSRTIPADKDYPVEFRLHHLILPLIQPTLTSP